MKKLKRDLPKPEKVVVKKTVVAKGDNLTKISKKYGIPVDKLIELNGIKNPDKIKIGEVIKLKKEYPEWGSPEWMDNTIKGVPNSPEAERQPKQEKEEYPEWGSTEWEDTLFEDAPYYVPHSEREKVKSDSEYEVVKGDNLTKISKKYGVPVDSLVKWNGIKNPDKIKIGEVIKLKKEYPVWGSPEWMDNTIKGVPNQAPQPKTQPKTQPRPVWGSPEWMDTVTHRDAPKHEVSKGDNLTKIAKKYGVSVNKLIELNGIKNPDKLKIGEVIKLSK